MGRTTRQEIENCLMYDNEANARQPYFGVNLQI